MSQDFNKPHRTTNATGNQQKKRLPIYILIIVGIFLAALIFYMTVDGKPTPSDAPPGHPNPSAEPAGMNSTNSSSATSNEATATDH